MEDEELQEDGLNEEDDTSTEDGHSEENETELEEDTFINESDESEGSEDESSEETVEFWKERATKAERDRDNYKQGLLSAKGKRRTLDGITEDKTSPSPKETSMDVDEEKVFRVLEKKNEKDALRLVLDSESEHYIHELMDDRQYNEIIGYIPRNLDRSSVESVVKNLKIATKIWKEIKGFDSKPRKKDKSGELASMRTTPNQQQGGGTKKEKRSLLPRKVSVDEWY